CRQYGGCGPARLVQMCTLRLGKWISYASVAIRRWTDVSGARRPTGNDVPVGGSDLRAGGATTRHVLCCWIGAFGSVSGMAAAGAPRCAGRAGPGAIEPVQPALVDGNLHDRKRIDLDDRVAHRHV